MNIESDSTFYAATQENQLKKTQYVYEFMRTEKPVKSPIVQDAFFWMRDIKAAHDLFLRLAGVINQLPEAGISAYFFHTMSLNNDRNSFAGYTARTRLDPSSTNKLELILPQEDTSALLLPDIPPYLVQEINRYAGANQINLSDAGLVSQFGVPELPPKLWSPQPQRFWRKFWRQ